MTKEFDQIIKEIYKQNKELDNIDKVISKELVKDINDIKKCIKGIEQKIDSLESIVEQVFIMINNISIFIDDAEEINDQDLEDEEDWTPYDERNFAYDDNDEEDIGGDNYWSNHEDDS